MPRELPLDQAPVPCQQETDLEMPGGDECPVDDRSGAVIATHGVDGYTHQSYQLTAISWLPSASLG